MKNSARKIYSTIRHLVPQNIRGIMSKWIFVLASRPTTKKDVIQASLKFPNKEQGGLIISADFEMAWAWRYTKTGSDYIQKGRLERENLPKIIKILEKYNIPITFATVGHLFLKECKKEDHVWMHRIPHFDDHWRFIQGDWYDHDPYSNFEVSPEWYAPDLIEMIIASEVKHELASHTFSHIDFSDRNCPPEVAEDELKACSDAATPFGIKLESMVFPGGSFGNIMALKKHGYKIYRKKDEYELAYPYRDVYGLLVSPSSGSLEFNLDYGWSNVYYLNRLKRILYKAIRTNTIAHLWFHPSLAPFFLDNSFPDFFSYADSLRQKGDLWIGTMKDLAKHINTNKIL